jgi:hypothetical protein
MTPPQEVSVPQQRFGHFYAVGAACNLSIILALLIISQSKQAACRASCPKAEDTSFRVMLETL